MDILLIAALTLLASFVGTIAGFGLSTILIPALVVFFDPVLAIFIAAIIHFFGNIWKLLLFRSGINWRLILLFGLPGMVTSYIGAMLLISYDSAELRPLLGLLFIPYALFLLINSRFKVNASDGNSILGGSLSGFTAGLFGIGGAVRSLFLTAFNLPKEMYIATAGGVGLLVDIIRLSTYIRSDLLISSRLIFGLIIFIPVSFLGSKLAKQFATNIPRAKFRMFIAVLLLIFGLYYLIS